MSRTSELWQEQQEMEQAHQAWEEQQAEQDMPAHKRSGYAERMAEQADMRRKEQRENRP